MRAKAAGVEDQRAGGVRGADFVQEFARGGEDVQHVAGIEFAGGDAKGGKPRGKVACEGAVRGGGLGDAVVFHHEQDRRPPQRGHVQRFIHCAFPQGAIPDENHGNRARTFDLLRQRHARRNRNRPPQNAVGVKILPVQMLGTAPPAAHARRLPHQFGEEGAHIPPVGEKMPVATVVAEDDVARLELGQHADRVRLLPEVGVGRPVKQPFREVVEDGLLKTAEAVELSIKMGKGKLERGHAGGNYTPRLHQK